MIHHWLRDPCGMADNNGTVPLLPEGFDTWWIYLTTLTILASGSMLVMATSFVNSRFARSITYVYLISEWLATQH